MVIAHHLILTGYGHWLPNDPRGSMSSKVHTPELAELADIHFGRKSQQPSRDQLREFYKQARGVLAHDVLWFNNAERQAIGQAIGDVVRRERLTCYACAVLSNHVHLLIRKHRLKGQDVHRMMRDAGRDKLHALTLAPAEHPVFSADALDVFKSSPGEVHTCVRYINGNFAKHRQTHIRHGFVVPYDNWPFHKKGAP